MSPPFGSGRAHDCLCVPTEALSDLLGEYVSSWNQRRPPTPFPQMRNTPRDTLTAVESLTASSGLTASQIDGIRRKRTRYTELRVADPLVAAMNRPEAFYDGSLPVIANPKASASTRASLTGALQPELSSES